MNAETYDGVLLLVEDNAGDARLIQEMLKDARLDMRVLHVPTLADAIAALAQTPVGAVLLDLTLPDSEGFDTLTGVLDAAPDTPVIVLTGFGDKDLGKQAIHVGAQDFLTKGQYDEHLLARSVDYAIERKVVQGAYYRSEERYQSLYTHSFTGIIICDEFGKIEDINDAGLSLLGYSRAECVALPIVSLFVEDQREALRDVLDGVLESGDHRPQREFQMLHKDGSIREIEFNAYAIRRGAAPAAIQCLISDITVRKRAEEALRYQAESLARANAELKEAQAQLVQSEKLAVVGQLAAGVAHEINNPSTYLFANLFHLQEIVKQLAAQAERMDATIGAGDTAGAVESWRRLSSWITEQMGELEAIASESLEGMQRIQDCVRDLRIFARKDDDDESIEEADVNAMCDSAINMGMAEFKHRATVVKDYTAIPAVRVRKGRILQVLLNLIMNSAQAMPEGDPAHNRITVSTRATEDAVIISVADTGHGIPQAIIDRIFDPFFTTKPRGVGTGLGLAISADIIRRHGGHLTVDSTEGDGATIAVVLPRHPAAASAPAPASTPAPALASASTERRPTVMIIDDEPSIRRALTRTLSRDFDVVTHETAQDALTALARNPTGVDAILCDLMMPEMTGIELYRALETELPDFVSRFFLLTGGATTADAGEFIDTHRDKCLSKPVTPETLLATLHDFLHADA